MIHPILLVAKKELLGVLRERRVLFTTLILPMLMMPVMMHLPLLIAGEASKATAEDTQKVAVSNVSDRVTTMLQAAQLEPVISTDVVAAVRNRSADAGVSWDGSTYMVHGRLSGMASKGALVVSKVREVLRAHSDEVVAASLTSRGVPLSVLEPFVVTTADASGEQEKSAGMLGFLVPFFLVLFILMGGTPVATDATAGEKERGTLEALLATPVPLRQILMGKGLAVLTMSLGATAAALVGLLVGSSLVQVLFAQQLAELTERSGGMMSVSMSIGAGTLPTIVITTVLFAVFVSSMLIAIGLYARTFKEAQSYFMPLQMLLVVPVMVLQFGDMLALPQSIYAVPILNVVMVLDGIVRGVATATQLLLTWGSTLLCAAAAFWFADRNFRREDIVFRN
jgi:sodium transport system permease protein